MNREPRMWFLSIVLLQLLALLLIASAHAETVTVSWSLPGTYTDGSMLPAGDITGFKVRCVSGCTANGFIGGSNTSLTLDVGTPAPGSRLCFVAQTVVGTETSIDSVQACKDYPQASRVPSAPKNVVAK